MKFLKKYKKILIICICISLLFVFYFRQHSGLCVIGYHAVVTNEEKENEYKDNPYYMSVTQFDKQMKYLYDHNYVSYTMKDVEDYINGKALEKHAICITFDDGYKNFNTVVKPILEKYHLKATCFVIGDKLSKSHKKSLNYKDLINDDTVEYYSHSYALHYKENNTYKLQTVSLEEIDEDFKKNPVDNTYFAYPYGKDRNDIDEVLKNNNVHLAFTYNNFRNIKRSDNIYHLPRYMIVSPMPLFYFKYVVK